MTPKIPNHLFQVSGFRTGTRGFETGLGSELAVEAEGMLDGGVAFFSRFPTSDALWGR